MRKGEGWRGRTLVLVDVAVAGAGRCGFLALGALDCGAAALGWAAHCWWWWVGGDQWGGDGVVEGDGRWWRGRGREGERVGGK